MKLQYLILALLLSTITAFAQNFEKALQDSPFMAGHKIHTLENGDILLAVQSAGKEDNSEPYSDRRGAKVYRLDPEGNILWVTTNLTLTFSDAVEVNDILVTPNNEIFVAMASGTCDIGGVSFRTAKIDLETGTILCTSESFHSAENAAGKLFLLDNSNVFYLASENIAVITNDCYINESGDIFLRYKDAIKLDDNTLMVVGEDFFGTVNFPTIGNPAMTSSDKSFINIERTSDGRFILLHEEGIIEIDIDQNILAEVIFPDDERFRTIAVDDESVFVAGITENDAIIKKYDLDLNFISDYSIEAPNLFPIDLHIDNGNLIVCGSDQKPFLSNIGSDLFWNGNGPRSTAWIKSISIDSMFNEDRSDVGISNITHDGFFAEDTWFGECFVYKDVTIQNVEVTVFNSGTTVVNRLNVSGNFNQCSVCNSGEPFTFAFDSLDLQPGTEIQITVGDIFTTSRLSSSEFCLWTSIPNNQIDTNPTNDSFCTTTDGVMVPVINIPNLENLNVYPNPVQNEFYVEYNLEKGDEVYFQIHDVLGNELLTTQALQKGSGLHQQAFATDEFISSNGIYLLTIHIGESQISRKLQVIRY